MYWVVGAAVVLVIVVLLAIGAWRFSTVRPNGVPCSLRALPQSEMDRLAASAAADAQAALEHEAHAAMVETEKTAGAAVSEDAMGSRDVQPAVDARAVAMATKKYLADHPLPVDAARWHHGVVILGENEAGFYRLRSLRPKADVIIPRSRTEIVCRRQGSMAETEYCDAQTVVLVHHEDGLWVELAIDCRFDTALVAWLESAPSDRTVRIAQLSGAATLPSLVGQEKTR